MAQVSYQVCSVTNKIVGIELDGFYLKLPQMSPNTSSLLDCVLLVGVDDPKGSTFVPVELPVDPPQISLPDPSKDGCGCAVGAPQTFGWGGGTGLLQLCPTFQSAADDALLVLPNGGSG